MRGGIWDWTWASCTLGKYFPTVLYAARALFGLPYLQTVSLIFPGWPWTLSTVQAILPFVILLPQVPIYLEMHAFPTRPSSCLCFFYLLVCWNSLDSRHPECPRQESTTLVLRITREIPFPTSFCNIGFWRDVCLPLRSLLLCVRCSSLPFCYCKFSEFGFNILN